MILKVTYRPEQSAKTNQSFSPSAKKPELFIELLKKSNYPIEIKSFEPLSRSILSETHSVDYVNGILDCKISNGFFNQLSDIANTLPFTTGSFVAASLLAFTKNECVFSPTSGFHHAHKNKAGGYCTFNGLVIAASELLKNGAKKIAIIDVDNHYGDGTASLLNECKLNSQVGHYSFGLDQITAQTAEDWLTRLPQILSKFSDAEIWLVQLGADPFIDDPLGGLLTLDQLYRRDKIIFQKAKQFNIPIAWNLAGGYTEDFDQVLQIHLNGVKAFFEVFG